MVNKDKTRVTGYIVTGGVIGFVNYRNQVFKQVPVREVVDRFYDHVEAMAR